MSIILDAKRRTAGRRTVFVCSNPPPSTRVPPWIILSVFVVLVAVILIPPLSRQSFVSGQRPLPDSATSLVKFQRSLSGVDTRLDVADAQYREASSSALRGRNLLALFDATNRYEAALDSLHKQVLSIDQPHSPNASTNAWALRARDVLVQRMSALRSANHLMVQAVDSGEISGLAIRAIETARTSADAKYEDQKAALRRSYEALGISRESIPAAAGARQ